MQNAGLDEAQAGIKIARRNINNLRYADDATEIGEKLKNILMRLKEENERNHLKTKYIFLKSKIMGSGPITSWQIEWEMVETVTNFLLLGPTITADGDCSLEIRR